MDYDDGMLDFEYNTRTGLSSVGVDVGSGNIGWDRENGISVDEFTINYTPGDGLTVETEVSIDFGDTEIDIDADSTGDLTGTITYDGNTDGAIEYDNGNWTIPDADTLIGVVGDIIDVAGDAWEDIFADDEPTASEPTPEELADGDTPATDENPTETEEETPEKKPGEAKSRDMKTQNQKLNETIDFIDSVKPEGIVDWSNADIDDIKKHQKRNGYIDPKPHWFGDDWPEVIDNMDKAIGVDKKDDSSWDAIQDGFVVSLEAATKVAAKTTGRIAIQIAGLAVAETIKAVADLSAMNDVADTGAEIAFFKPQMKLYEIYKLLTDKEKKVFGFVMNSQFGVTGFGSDVRTVYTSKSSNEPALVSFGSLRGSHNRILNKDKYFNKLMDEMKNYGINIDGYMNERKARFDAENLKDRADMFQNYFSEFGSGKATVLKIKSNDMTNDPNAKF